MLTSRAHPQKNAITFNSKFYKILNAEASKPPNDQEDQFHTVQTQGRQNKSNSDVVMTISRLKAKYSFIDTVNTSKLGIHQK